MEHDESDPTELEEITPRGVGILVHLIASTQTADYRLAVKQTLYEIYRGRPEPPYQLEADRLGRQLEEAKLDAEVSVGAVTDWLRAHLPAPVCPDGSCAGRHHRSE